MPAKPAPAKKTTPLADLVDELGALEKEYAIILAPFKMKLPRLEALRKELREACPVAKDKEWSIDGERFRVELSPRADWRIVDVAKLIKAIGQKAFNAFASVSLKDLEAHPAVSADILRAVVTKDRIGPRTIKTFEKGSA
jgi:hypothetical protein